MKIYSKISPNNFPKGFSLVELMIAMLISLILIGGTISVFLSNQQTYRTTQELDGAQEAFRFSSQIMIRVVRQGTSFETNSSGTELRVIMDGEPGSGIRDCLGNEVDQDDVVNSFELIGNNIVCSVSAGNRSEILVTDVGAMNFRYGDSDGYWETRIFDAGSDSLVNNAFWNTSSPDDKRSVAAELRMDGSGLTSRFTATLRSATVAQ